MEIEQIKLAQQLRSIREYKGYSQEVLAQHLGISQQAYQKIESAKIRLSEERLQQILSFLQLEDGIPDGFLLEEMLKAYHKDGNSISTKELVKEVESVKNELKKLKRLNIKILKLLEKSPSK